MRVQLKERANKLKTRIASTQICLLLKVSNFNRQFFSAKLPYQFYASPMPCLFAFFKQIRLDFPANLPEWTFKCERRLKAKGVENKIAAQGLAG